MKVNVGEVRRKGYPKELYDLLRYYDNYESRDGEFYRRLSLILHSKQIKISCKNCIYLDYTYEDGTSRWICTNSHKVAHTVLNPDRMCKLIDIDHTYEDIFQLF